MPLFFVLYGKNSISNEGEEVQDNEKSWIEKEKSSGRKAQAHAVAFMQLVFHPRNSRNSTRKWTYRNINSLSTSTHTQSKTRRLIIDISGEETDQSWWFSSFVFRGFFFIIFGFLEFEDDLRPCVVSVFVLL